MFIFSYELLSQHKWLSQKFMIIIKFLTNKMHNKIQQQHARQLSRMKMKYMICIYICYTFETNIVKIVHSFPSIASAKMF